MDAEYTLAMDRKKMITLLVLLLGVLSLPFILDTYISITTRNKVYRDLAAIQPKRAAVVLGTSKYTSGRHNLFYDYRLNAVAELWNNNKIDAVLVSGDNSRRDYNEPQFMKNDLIMRGIPEEYITLDYAGFRTLDSIVRASVVFMLDDFIVVSQPFHCQRAIYIANTKNIRAIAYGAQPIGGVLGSKVRLREVLARTRAILDLHVFSVQPKFLGKHEVVRYRNR